MLCNQCAKARYFITASLSIAKSMSIKKKNRRLDIPS